MSLVLEALRRVERSDARPGSVGVAVSSYRPAHRRSSALLPLLLGLLTGAVLVFLWRPQGKTAVPALTAASSSPVAQLKAPSENAQPAEGPGLDPLKAPMVAGTVTLPNAAAVSDAPPRAPSEPPGPPVRPPLTLQAISERDSRPIAVINDQLVREGDLFEGARILRIGAESVDVLLESGQKATVRFGIPLPAAGSPSPDPF